MHPNPREAITACRAALDAVSLDQSPEKNTELVARGCGAIFAEPDCRAAWERLRFAAGLGRFVETCRDRYCPLVAGGELPICRMKQLPKDEERWFDLWAPLERRILRRDLGSPASAPLVAWKLRASRWLFLGALRVDTPRLTRAPAPPQHLNLRVRMTPAGYTVTTRFGEECPRPHSERKSAVCFATSAPNQFTAPLIKALQHHLWYLHAAKYRDAKYYQLAKERHEITLAPSPTIKYRDILRTMDAAREIPRDAKKPPLTSAVPPGGCAFASPPKMGGGSPRAASGPAAAQGCMYHLVTLALGKQP